MTTAADVWRVYSKPSLKGALIFRKRTSKQTSSRLQARKQQLANLKGTPKAPATECHKELVEAKKCVRKMVYVPGSGYQEREVCPIELMRSCLRTKMKALPVATPTPAPK